MSTNNTKTTTKAMTEAELANLSKEELIRLALASQKKAKDGMKVTEKGALSVYGFGRFPVTLYLSQWEIMFEKIEAIKAFIEANRALLTVKSKDDKAA